MWLTLTLINLDFMSSFTRKKVIYLLRTLNIGGAERYVVETATGINQEKLWPIGL